MFKAIEKCINHGLLKNHITLTSAANKEISFIRENFIPIQIPPPDTKEKENQMSCVCPDCGQPHAYRRGESGTGKVGID